jgi:hypothetical protein
MKGKQRKRVPKEQAPRHKEHREKQDTKVDVGLYNNGKKEQWTCK